MPTHTEGVHKKLEPRLVTHVGWCRKRFPQSRERDVVVIGNGVTALRPGHLVRDSLRPINPFSVVPANKQDEQGVKTLHWLQNLLMAYSPFWRNACGRARRIRCEDSSLAPKAF